jgi:hypothetical protein
MQGVSPTPLILGNRTLILGIIFYSVAFSGIFVNILSTAMFSSKFSAHPEEGSSEISCYHLLDYWVLDTDIVN